MFVISCLADVTGAMIIPTHKGVFFDIVFRTEQENEADHKFS